MPKRNQLRIRNDDGSLGASVIRVPISFVISGENVIRVMAHNAYISCEIGCDDEEVEQYLKTLNRTKILDIVKTELMCFGDEGLNPVNIGNDEDDAEQFLRLAEERVRKVLPDLFLHESV